ncbi:flavin-containing monooxygenase [Yinghuangia seranimata]|uniref:flavin-containing monooxygenase n=1 Tax=Yinghuangia seranimata TaxID=408067 RepID=UPI00248C3FF8|nr:NAD(P)/FAD-dependent oxidoreductase [Yinghuangia seranimata]MDI2129810.1 NAD(P)/FAD-dependent oxidoreductase [Yinghuangia seranimata]
MPTPPQHPLDTAAQDAAQDPLDGPVPHVRVAVVGSGFSGLGAGARLLKYGIDDFVILERGKDVGGTWRDNTYPGACCDVPSNLYSFSFAPNPTWSRSFSPQPEIQEYLRTCARDFGLLPHLRFEHEVRMARWNDAAAYWEVETSRGRLNADVLLAGGGPLVDPAYPDIKGLTDTFEGELFHSARWNHDYDLRGKRVAVIGTGASAIQFVPQIQPDVAHLDLYQRSAPWIMPRTDRAFTGAERALYRSLPAAQRAVRLGLFWGREGFWLWFNGKHPRLAKRAEGIARAHLKRAVRDPELREKLTPDFTFGCKRVLLSNDYYPALAQPNVDVVTDGIAEVKANSVVTKDGVERPCDAIVLGTGFHATDIPMAHALVGRDGVLLADAWKDGMTAHQAAMTTGFPNLFFVIGPNSGLGHSSMTLVIEAQIKYAVDAIVSMERNGIAEIDVTREAQDAYNARLQAKMSETVWTTGGCSSWYLDPRTGTNTTLWPDYVWKFMWMNRRFSPAGHRARTREQVRADAAAAPVATAPPL